MNNYCNKITLPYEPLVPEYDLRLQTEIIKVIDLKYVNPDLVSFFNKLDVIVSYAECFHRKPKNVGLIHADSAGGDFVKINWIYDGDQSYMEWFEPAEQASTSFNFTGANTPYSQYSLDQVTLVERRHLKGSYLVQVGVPHRVVNHLEDRYCFCLTLSDLSNRRLTMAQAQVIFADYITD